MRVSVRKPIRRLFGRNLKGSFRYGLRCRAPVDVSSVKSGQLDVLEALAGSLAVKAVEGNILAVICINRLTEIGQVLALEAHAAVAQRDAVRTAHQEAGRSDFLDALIVTRTQVIQTALPLALAAQRDLYAVEHDVLDMVALAAGNDAVVNDNVFEITGALGADLERGGGRGQRTAREFFMVIPVKVI